MSNKFIVVFFMMFFAASSVYGAIPISDVQPAIEKKIEKQRPEVDPNSDRNLNRNANLAFAFGLGSIVFPPLAVPALILGIISLAKKEPREGFALTGVIIGGLYILLFLVLMVLLFVALL